LGIAATMSCSPGASSPPRFAIRRSAVSRQVRALSCPRASRTEPRKSSSCHPGSARLDPSRLRTICRLGLRDGGRPAAAERPARAGSARSPTTASRTRSSRSRWFVRSTSASPRRGRSWSSSTRDRRQAIRRQARRHAPGSGAAIGNAGLSLGPPAGQPLGGSSLADAGGLGRHRQRPAFLFDPADQELATLRAAAGITDESQVDFAVGTSVCESPWRGVGRRPS